MADDQSSNRKSQVTFHPFLASCVQLEFWEVLQKGLAKRKRYEGPLARFV